MMKKYIIIVVLAMLNYLANAQELPEIKPYCIQVTYDKTTHLIFPSEIRYVDLGSEYLIAGKADDANNVLRVKASVKEFEAETNISVITNDGKYYVFNVYYSIDPDNLSYDIVKDKDRGNVRFDELTSTEAAKTDALMKYIFSKNRKVIKYIGSRSYGINFFLKSIHIDDGKYFFHTEIENHTSVSYNIDLINFKIVDRKQTKRTVIQENQLNPIRNYNQIEVVSEHSKVRDIYILDQFTITEDKVLVIELFEKNGGRHQVLKLDNTDLINAKLLKHKPIKF